MKMKWIALAVAAAIPAAAMAIGGASGPKIDYEVQGHIGEVMGNPYGIAPLTAVIRDGGYTLADVTVHIVPKQGGQKDQLQGLTLAASHARRRSCLRAVSGLSKHHSC